MINVSDAYLYTALKLELKKREEREQEENLRAYYRDNPLEYFEKRLGIRKESIKWSLLPEYKNHRWDGTPDPLFAIIQGLQAGKWIGVESATGTGKTHFGAMVVRWFLETQTNSLVVTTAPKERQLKLHIWKELTKLQNKAPVGEFLSLALRMVPGQDHWIATGFVAGVKADEDVTTKAQGFHAENMLFVLEETPGIPEPIISAFENTCISENNLILAFGNPDSEFDALHKFCMRDDVEHIIISALDHPNVVLKNGSFIPGATSLNGINKIITKYGSPEHPLALSRTRGICPKQSEDALIRLEWIKYIQENLDPEQFKIDKTRALGVDVANSETGDEASICEGIGAYCLSVEAFKCPDANQLGKIKVAQRMADKRITPDFVGVDGVGVGAGTVNALKEIGLKVNNLIGGERQIEIKGQTELFNNLRSQMYWQTREDIKSADVWVPNDPELIADLTAPKWTETDKVIKVESKDDIKKRLGRSPNKGDAFVYWNFVRQGFYKKKTIKARQLK